MKTVQLTIQGMTCGHCSNFVKDVVTELDGVVSATVDHLSGKADLQYDESKISPEQIGKAIDETHIYKVVH